VKKLYNLPVPIFARSRRAIEYHARSAGGSMDFIERIFGVSPDGGNGSLEFIYVIGIVVAVTLIARALCRRRSRERSEFPR
jgi:hypothetical protein